MHTNFSLHKGKKRKKKKKEEKYLPVMLNC